ncbi:MAG: AAA family ATPase [Janthinobacterium lividum]
MTRLLQEKISHPLFGIEKEEFEGNFPASWQPVDMFQQSFGRLFGDYRRNLQENTLKCVANSTGETVAFLTDDQFKAKFGEAPWDFANNVLEAANLDFRIISPTLYEDTPYEPILIDQVTKSQIKFVDLSSGEKVLMSFAFCMYYATDQRQLVDYPQVLLFDEIDAPLHPSMTQSLLKVIQEVLVQRHGMKVVMTTHSPSTVALSPEGSLYAMHKMGELRLQKTSKDGALALLTTGVPTLSINYENRRQVFVESNYDAQFYGTLYSQMRSHIIPEISLEFIAVGKNGVGNCDQVQSTVKGLAERGCRTVYGIIDWDLKNVADGYVKVLGHGNRYSIENYIFDPVLVAAFLIREKFIDRTKIGLQATETYIDFSNFDDVRLQLAADFVVNEVKAKAKPSNENTDVLYCRYLNGRSVNLPVWFVQLQGHGLEDNLKDIFPQLQRFQKEDALKREILVKVIDDIPLLIPEDILFLFKDIQNQTGDNIS